jgi:hypothetical protein
MDFAVQMWRFLGARKKYWLLPIIIITVMLGDLLILATGLGGRIIRLCAVLGHARSWHLGLLPRQRARTAGSG